MLYNDGLRHIFELLTLKKKIKTLKLFVKIFFCNIIRFLFE